MPGAARRARPGFPAIGWPPIQSSSRCSSAGKSIEKNYEQNKKAYNEWRATAAKAKAEGKSAARRPRDPDGDMKGNFRPGNIYNGVLLPTIGYGIRGVDLVPGRVERRPGLPVSRPLPPDDQDLARPLGPGRLPVLLGPARRLPEREAKEPAESAWAELREAQTMTMSQAAPHRRGRDHRPRRRQRHPSQEQARRRQAAGAVGPGARTTASRSPARARPTRSMEKQGNKIILTFDHVDGGFRPFDVSEPRGFTIAGSDHKFAQGPGQDHRPRQDRGLVRQGPRPRRRALRLGR